MPPWVIGVSELGTYTGHLDLSWVGDYSTHRKCFRFGLTDLDSVSLSHTRRQHLHQCSICETPHSHTQEDSISITAQYVTLLTLTHKKTASPSLLNMWPLLTLTHKKTASPSVLNMWCDTPQSVIISYIIQVLVILLFSNSTHQNKTETGIAK
jgi:hypothetical protein